MNYAEMTDFEINKAVGEIALEGKWACKPGCSGNKSDSWYYGSVDTFVTPYSQLPDYCNSWTDAGPIIQENLIALKPVPLYVGGYRWFATEGDGLFGLKAADNNPLRAAMMLFLAMQEKANA
ncbi:hypothetical protein ID10_08735 [Pantoea agglomerans]|uniref:phage protein NinX family protein n=1 Tax=Enterobacter agglomerans TaxID=549 RepID=UPI00050EBEB0|nr:phage protein NinX family protein [Pantoea agglomerans]KGD79778.1 hypothetical protein ID10_08735 [Pantoea agglomerans]